MVPQRDAHPGGEEHENKEQDLEPIQPVMPDIKRGGGQGQKKGADQKGAGLPIDTFYRDTEDLH